MQLIPAIDVLEGKVVRLRQGDFDRVTEYVNEPLEWVRRFADAGARSLHVVNLSGVREGNLCEEFFAMIRGIAAATNLEIHVGGGIRTIRDMQELLAAGAARVVLGTMLFKNPDAVRGAVKLFGPTCIIAALDVRGMDVQIAGWQENGGIDLFRACQRVADIGIRTIFVTDVARDGMETGPNVDLYREIQRRFPSLRLISSGGVRNAADLAALQEVSCDAVVVGRALLEGTLPLSTFNEFPRKNEDISRETAAGSGLAIRVIPCLDVANGRVVKGTSFQNLRDAGDPVELAKRYCAEGADELVFLDIAATKDNRETAYELVARVADAVNIPFTIGGGICSVADARRLLDAGADKVSVNSAAVDDPLLLSTMAKELGSANVVCAIDAKRKTCHPEPVEGWNVLIRGGSIETDIDAVEWVQEAVDRGAGELLVTSYDRDGTGAGFDTELLARIKAVVSVPVIASGGAGSLSSFVDAVSVGKADAVLAASVFHFGKFSIRDVKSALRSASFLVRL